MTDRELLELAAKAAGIDILWHATEREEWCYIPSARPPHNRREGDKNSGTIWDPLADDGDALRLAVKLKMAVDIGGGGFVHALCGEPECTEAMEDMKPDPYAAARRAIVRAAAEIGKGMK